MADDFGNGDAMDLPMSKAAVNRLIKDNSDLFSDKHCKVCSAVLISESQKLAHYQSKKHANKYRRYMSIHKGEDFSPAKRMKTDDTVVQETSTAADDGDRNKCCPICNMAFSSPVVAMSHYEGKTHAKNLKMKEQGGVPQGSNDYKDTQNTVFIGEERMAGRDRRTPRSLAHRTGPPPPPRVKPTKPNKPAPPRAPPANLDKSDPDKFCQLCSATFNNPHMAEQHYKGRRHLKQETKSQLMTIYTSTGEPLPQTAPLTPKTSGSGATGNWYNCDICNVVLNSIEQYQAHISGAKHKNKLLPPEPSDNMFPVPDRKSYGGMLSPNLLSSEAPSSRFSLSSGGYSAAGNFSSQPGGGLLPPPPHTHRSFLKDTIGPEDYNYYSQDY